MLKPIAVDKSRHDEVMDALPRPSWLKSGELRDNVWIVCTSDPDRHRKAFVTFDFNQPIRPWPNSASLLDAEFENDLITIKLVLYYSLRPRPIGWNTAASSLKYTFLSQLTFVRWRVDGGTRNNSSLKPAHFTAFDSAFASGGRDGLLNLRARARNIMQAANRGEIQLLSNGRKGVKSTHLAGLMGLSSGSSLTTISRAEIEEHFKKNGGIFTRSTASRKSSLEKKTYFTRETALVYFNAWFHLWKLRDLLPHDPVGYQAFKNARAVSKWVSKWPSANTTDDAPAYQASCLINGALKLVLDGVCTEVIELVDGGIDSDGNMSDPQKLASINQRLRRLGFRDIGPHFQSTRWTISEAISVSKFLYGVIPASARIIQAAFSARRNEELDSLHVDCIHNDQAGDTWLECAIVKNVANVDRVPVPKSVARAVDIVVKISQMVKRQTKRLYDFVCPIKKKSVPFELSSYLGMVRDYFNVPELDDGSSWHFTPHQFRKFFGVVYHWRWAFPNLTALTFHYRHYNPDTTRRYIEMKAAEALRMRDEKQAASERKRHVERLGDFESAKTGFVAWVLQQVVKGEQIGGAFGRRIWTEVEDLKRRFLPEMQLVDAAQESGSFDEAIEALIGSTTIQMHPEGHSICGCGPDLVDISSAKCLALREQLTGQSPTASTGPDFEFAEDERCIVCANRGQLTSLSPYWTSESAKAEKAWKSASPAQRLLLSRRITAISEHA